MEIFQKTEKWTTPLPMKNNGHIPLCLLQLDIILKNEAIDDDSFIRSDITEPQPVFQIGMPAY